MSQTSRADLLRGMARGAGMGLVIEDDGVHRWGYGLKPRPVEAMPALPVGVDALPSAGESTVAARARGTEPNRLPLRMPEAWVFDLLDAGDVEERIDAATPLPLSELEPLATDPAPYQDLVTWARVLPGLRRHSDVDTDVGIDWPHLMDRLARRELPPRWPRQSRRRWADPVMLVLDCSPRLAPFRHDFHALAQRVQALLPDSSLSIRTIVHGPASGWRAWRNPRRPASDAVSGLHCGPQAWRVLAGATVLVASDLGAFEDAGDGSAQEEWLAWSRDLCRQGAHLVALAPVGSGALSPALLASCTVVRWSPDSRWKRERASGQAPTVEPESAVQCLLALASTALRVDPPLLRAWCRLVDPACDADLEGRFWNHPDVVPHALSCALRAERVDQHLRAYARLPTWLRDAAHQACRVDHAHLRRSLSVAEDLRHATAEAGGTADLGRRTIEGLLRRARAVATLSSMDRQALLQAAQLIQSTAVDRVRALDPALFAALDGFVANAGGQRPVSAAVRSTHWQWVQQGDRIFLDPTQRAHNGQRLAPPFELRAPADQVWALVGEVVYQRALPPDGLVLPMAWLAAGSAELGVGPWRWRVRTVRAPAWVEGAEMRDGQLILSHTAPDGQRVEWGPDIIRLELFKPLRSCLEEVKLLARLKRLHDTLHYIRQFGIRAWREELVASWPDDGEPTIEATIKYLEAAPEIVKLIERIRNIAIRLPPSEKFMLRQLEIVATYELPRIKQCTKADFIDSTESFASRVQNLFSSCDSQMGRSASRLNDFYRNLAASAQRALDSKRIDPEQEALLRAELDRLMQSHVRVQHVLENNRRWQQVHDKLEIIDVNIENGSPRDDDETRLAQQKRFSRATTDLVESNGEEVKWLLLAATDIATQEERLREWPKLIFTVGKNLENFLQEPKVEHYEAMRKYFDDLFFQVDLETLRVIEIVEDRVRAIENCLQHRDPINEIG